MKQVLDKGPSLKIFQEAQKLYANGYEDQALSRYIYLAAQGYEMANFNAAFILERSKNPIHFKRAAFFYSRSAIMDNLVARRKLGDAFSKMGDQVSAVAHYVIAAKADIPDPEALFNLGYAYETGIGLRKDLWSALDMYTASLAHGKSGKIAVSLALVKVRTKLFFQYLKSILFTKSSSKYKKKPIISRKDSDKFQPMLLTLLLTGIMYWYINYYHPRQQNRRVIDNLAVREMETRVTENNSLTGQLNESSSPEQSLNGENEIMQTSEPPVSQSEFTEFRFRNNRNIFEERENQETEEVD